MAFDDRWGARHDQQKVDLVFIVDCTASMGPYIKQAQENIQTIAETVSRTAFSVRLALVEYRDHPPQDKTFVTRVHDFTFSVGEMKTWVDDMSASGGGDIPESVACALQRAASLSYRETATKMCVLIGNQFNSSLKYYYHYLLLLPLSLLELSFFIYVSRFMVEHNCNTIN